MCTVTIIPKGKNDFVLTSNRDEAPNRVSLKPEFYTIDETKVLFPKDELSGGTWIGVSEKNRLICVLNGGFEFHERKSEYRLSRGVVANHFMIADALKYTVDTYNFEDIEPFTMVIADWNTDLEFYELVWDGTEKHFIKLPLEPKIWSSSTLYSKAMKTERLDWFEGFKSENELNKDSLINFFVSHNTLKNTLIDGVDFSNTQEHTLTELLYISFMETSAERLSLEWNLPVVEVQNRLSGITTHVYEEFPFLGYLYYRNEIESFAPFQGLPVSTSVREESVKEINHISQ